MASRLVTLGLALATVTLALAGCVERPEEATGPPQGGTERGDSGARGSEASWQGAVEAALGTTGETKDGVLKFTFPRSDLEVAVQGVQVDPALALGSWVAFKESGNGTLMLGDLVLLEEEVPTVMTRLQEGRVEQTALHSHLMLETPDVKYMHIRGQGDAAELAAAVRAALNTTATPTGPSHGAEVGPTGDTGFNTDMLDGILRHNGTAKGGSYHFSVPRAGNVTVDGTVVPPSMGTAVALGFQPTGGGRAATTGDFVLTADEVNPVIRALRESGLNVTAIHNHMLVEEPRLFFVHFWAVGEPAEIARGLRAVLDEVDVVPGSAGA